MTQFDFNAGVFPDVALEPNGRGWLIVREGDPKSPGYIVVLSWQGADMTGLHEFARYPVPGGSPAFPRIYAHDGLVWVAYHDGTIGHLRCLTTGTHERLDPCQNNEPIAFGAGYVAWQGAAADGWPVSRMHLTTGVVVDAGHGQGTGLAYVGDRGWVVLVDDNRLSEPGMVNPVRAGGLIVGEDPDPANRDNLGALWSLAGKRGTLWPSTPCLTPRCAVAGSLVAVTTWGQGAGVRVFVGTADELPTVTPPVIVPPIVSPPEPETPVMPESLFPLVEEIFSRRLGHLGRPATNDECAAVMNAVAWLARADGWGLSKKPSGNNAAQPTTGIRVAYDILQHRPSDTLWDALGPSENPQPLWGQAHPHNDPDRPWVAPVAPDGVVAPTPPVPAPIPPIVAPTPCACAAELARISSAVDVLFTAAADLQAEAGSAKQRIAAAEIQSAKALELAKSPRPLPKLRARGKAKLSWGGVDVDVPVVPE